METSMFDLRAPKEMSAKPSWSKAPSCDSRRQLWPLPHREACCQDGQAQHRVWGGHRECYRCTQHHENVKCWVKKYKWQGESEISRCATKLVGRHLYVHRSLNRFPHMLLVRFWEVQKPYLCYINLKKEFIDKKSIEKFKDGASFRHVRNIGFES